MSGLPSLRQLFTTTMRVLMMTSLLVVTPAALGDVALLVDQGTLVEIDPPETTTTPEPDNPDDTQDNPDTQADVQVGTASEATYVSSSGFAVTGANFIDAATYIFDFGTTGSVTAATLRLPIRDVFPQNDATPVQVTFFSDEDGVIDVADYSIGFNTPLAVIDATMLTELSVDVTGAVNAAISASRYVGFRVQSTIAPSSVDEELFPPQVGVRFETNPLLEFVPGTAPVVANDSPRFDGYTLQVPDIDVPSIGVADAEFKLVDPNQLAFQMISAIVTEEVAGPPPLSGADLFDCDAFTAPEAVGVAIGASSYSVNSGILDVPSVDLNGEQIAIRMELVEGSDPVIFEGLSIDAVQSGPSESIDSALEGGSDCRACPGFRALVSRMGVDWRLCPQSSGREKYYQW